jgi:hypothetical protein
MYNMSCPVCTRIGDDLGFALLIQAAEESCLHTGKADLSYMC